MLPPHGFHGHPGYWFPITATIDWCEWNYCKSPYIAEFWNTVSSLAFILFGIYGLYQAWQFEKRFKFAFCCLILIGFSSLFFHATLKWTAQLSDEIAMFMLALSLVYILIEQRRIQVKNPLLPWLLLAILGLFTLTYSVLKWKTWMSGIGFFLILPIMVRFLRLAQAMEITDRKFYRSLILIFIGSAICWILEWFLCRSYSIIPILHVCWHIGAAFSLYAIITGYLYHRLRYVRRNKNVSIDYYAMIPFISTILSLDAV